jgi:hypothetical protein
MKRSFTLIPPDVSHHLHVAFQDFTTIRRCFYAGCSHPSIPSIIEANGGSMKMLEASMQTQDTKIVTVPTPAITDAGKVRMGSMSPSLPVRTTPIAVADSGKVRMGSMSTSLPVRSTPASVADRGKVRMGSMSPAL